MKFVIFFSVTMTRFVRGLGFIVIHARHEFYHILLGLFWAWFLRERWNEFNIRWIWFSMLGSLLPDMDHLLYFFVYGKRDQYSILVKTFLRAKKWRSLTVFVEKGHKEQTNLISHNYFSMMMLLGCSLLSSLSEWRIGVILFGAMIIHYMFDIMDDLFQLGRVNPNWKRWGRNKKNYAHEKI